MSIRPTLGAVSFSCPHCNAFAAQSWFRVGAVPADQNTPPKAVLSAKAIFLKNQSVTVYPHDVGNVHLSKCFACGQFTLWVGNQILYPASQAVDQPGPDVPPEVACEYIEASRIVNVSPRGAAALLRLAIQKLCIHLGERGQNINQDIASLVVKGLMPIVQQSLDAVRVIGNEAVHPGTIDLRDDRETALQLFSLVQIICDQMITRPRQANEVYAKLPKSIRDAIDKRDNRE